MAQLDARLGLMFLANEGTALRGSVKEMDYRLLHVAANTDNRTIYKSIAIGNVDDDSIAIGNGGANSIAIAKYRRRLISKLIFPCFRLRRSPLLHRSKLQTPQAAARTEAWTTTGTTASATCAATAGTSA
jgi:hypothetical protein